MKITITTLSDVIFTLDVSDDMELENFKALCEYESGIPAQEIVVMHEGRPLLEDKKALVSYGIKEGDVLLLQQFVQQRIPTPEYSSAESLTSGSGSNVGIDFSSITIPNFSNTSEPMNESGSTSSAQGQDDDPAYIMETLLRSPEEVAVLKHNNPKLADALLSRNLEKFTAVLREQQKQRADRERQRIRIMNADPFDMEAQKLIAEEIRQQNVDLNMEVAMEYHPESFGQVVMLYINCKVNGHYVKAFIDSGAQTTIMSQACAERCSIMRLVDTRWAGIAKGVGTQKIIGRVHLVQIQIEKDFLTSSFSILEEQPMDMLLGLDMLKRHQCCIDLKRNVLIIGTTGTETPFLHEGDLPECARLQVSQLPMPSHAMQEQEDKQLAEALARSASEHPEAKVNSAPSHSCSLPPNNLQPSDKFTEVDIQNLTKLGFPRQTVVEELRNFNGDSNQAMAALFAKSLRLP